MQAVASNYNFPSSCSVELIAYLWYMLTLNDFNALIETEKANAVWQGTFLADRQENEFTIQLYTVNNFYVEVFYDPASNQITGFRSFDTNDLLVPYLAHHKFNIHQ